MLGSHAHAWAIRRAKTPLHGMVSLEMLGYTDRRPGGQHLPPELVGRFPDVGDFIGICGNAASRGLVETFVRGFKMVGGLPCQSIVVPGRGDALPAVRLSDHSSFWDLDYPAIMVTDTAFLRNPHYHQATDLPETLDYPFLAKVTAGVCAAVSEVLRWRWTAS
jgi:hypothetical protein